jgi:hypothetical protein
MFSIKSFSNCGGCISSRSQPPEDILDANPPLDDDDVDDDNDDDYF